VARPVLLKTAIYQAALDLFGEKGFSETSIRDIARRASVSEGSLYRHWPSKLALGWDIFKSNQEALATETRRRLQSAPSPCQQIQTIIAMFYELYDRDSNLFRFLLLKHHQMRSRMGETSDNLVSLWELFVSSKLDASRDDSHFLHLAASITLGMILQPAVSALYGSISTPLLDHVNEVTAQVCKVLDLHIQPLNS